MTLSWLQIVRLGLVQLCLGAIVVLTTSTLNRLMVVELALPAMLSGALVALHSVVQITRPSWGFLVRRAGQPHAVHHRRHGGAGAGAALAVAGWWRWGLPGMGCGLAVSVLAYVLIGIGAGASGTSLLALLATGCAPAAAGGGGDDHLADDDLRHRRHRWRDRRAAGPLFARSG